jgi:RNA polymerase sigma-70 factor, ECF subfamily
MDGQLSVTELLQNFSVTRDREVAEIILREVEPVLRQIAAGTLRRESKVRPLTPTELINEAWVTRLHKGQWQIHDRGEFFAIAARAMRLILVDLARRRAARKRGDRATEISLDLWTETPQGSAATPEQIVAIDEILRKLMCADPAAAIVFEMKYFGGFTFEEIAELRSLQVRQVRHRWDKANDWLKKRFKY